MKIPVSVGDSICVAGYVMDYFCIDRTTLLDKPHIGTLSAVGPISHSVHCLVDIGTCVRSNYEILQPLNDGTGNYGRAWRIQDNTDVVAHARRIGSCGTCEKRYNGEVSEGYQATLNATVLDLGTNSTPALIQVTAVQDYDVGCGGLEYEIPSMVIDGGGDSGLSYASLVVIHGALMVLAWGLLLPAGAIIARLAKHKPDGLWFKLHSSIQSVGLLLAIVGFWIALQNFGALETRGHATLNYPHAVCGVLTMALGIFQPINALVRPHVSAEISKSITRKIWEVVHKGLGYTTLLLAVATIILGTRITPTLDIGMNFVITFVIFLVLLFLLIVALILDKKKYNYSRANVKSNESDVDAEV
jgi:hypothetical protein